MPIDSEGRDTVAKSSGWRVAPIEPTEAMLHEMWRALNGASSLDHATLRYAWGRALAAAPHTAAPADPSPAWRHWFRHSPGALVGILSAFEDPALTRMGGDIGAVYERSDRLEVVVRAPAADRVGSERIPFGWARSVCTPDTPMGAAEYDVDMHHGEDRPPGDGWVPLYTDSAPPADRAELAAECKVLTKAYALQLVENMRRLGAGGRRDDLAEGRALDKLFAAIEALARSTDAPLRQKIADAFGIGADARTDEVIMRNLSNTQHRVRCLDIVERELFTIMAPDEDDPDGPEVEECQVNSWSAEPEQYLEQVRAFLATPPAAATDDVGRGLMEGSVPWPFDAPAAATSTEPPDSTPSEEAPEEQIIEAIRDLAEDGGRWPSDWVEACRRAIKLATPAAATSTPCASGEGEALNKQITAAINEVWPITTRAPSIGKLKRFAHSILALAATQAPAVPATDRDPQGMSARAVELHEKAFMPWPDAQELAFSEAGYTDEDLHEFVGEHASGTRVLVEDEIEVFARAVLVHCSDILGCEPARTPTAGNTEDARSMGASEIVQAEPWLKADEVRDRLERGE